MSIEQIVWLWYLCALAIAIILEFKYGELHEVFDDGGIMD